MYPILFEYKDIVVPSWHVFFVTAVILAYFLFIYLCKTCVPAGMRRYLSMLFLLCYLASYFGARLFAIVVEEDIKGGSIEYLKALFSLGPLTFYGGAIAAFVVGLWYVYHYKLPLKDLLNCGFVVACFGLAVGRVGCFLNGCDYGVVIDEGSMFSWMGVKFPFLNGYRYPTQLIEAVFALLLGCVSLLYFNFVRRKFGVSSVAVLVVLAYSIFRFCIEYVRGDVRGWVIDGVLSPAQFISLILVVVIALWVFLRNSFNLKGLRT